MSAQFFIVRTQVELPEGAWFVLCVDCWSRQELNRVDTMLEYKGYTGRVELDRDEGIFHGEVIDLRDVITFQGTSVEEIEVAFRSSIDDYLEFCEELGEDPDRPFKGRFMLRLPPELHRKAYVSAVREGKSLNQWIADQLDG